MSQTILLQKGNSTLWGDPRDVLVPTDLRGQVLSWCWLNGVKARLPLNKDNQHISRVYFGVDVWRVKDDKQRTMFTLKWS